MRNFFATLGVTNIRTFVDLQNPSSVGVLIDVPDMDDLDGGDGDRACIRFHGVRRRLPETLVVLVET